MRESMLSILLLGALPALIFAQNPQTPDLSGTWVLNLSKSKLGKLNPIHSESVVITHSGPNLAMHFTANGKEAIHEYVTDGKLRVVFQHEDGERVEKAYWKKSAFVTVVIDRLRAPHTPADGIEIFHLKDRWTLSTDGCVLTDESEGGVEKTLSIYDKQ